MDDVLTWLSRHWEFVVGTAIGIIGIVIAVVTILYQRQPKTLDYEIRDDVRMRLPNAASLNENLEVTWADYKMTDPRIVLVRTMNTGKRAILEKDFEGGEPVCIAYESNGYFDAGIVRASTGLTTQNGVEIDWTAAEAKVYLRPQLLNPRDWFDIQLLSDGPHGSITITSRFADQSRPMKNRDVRNDKVLRRWGWMGMIGMFVINTAGSTSLAVVSSLKGSSLPADGLIVTTGTMSTLTVIVTAYVMYRGQRSIRFPAS